MNEELSAFLALEGFVKANTNVDTFFIFLKKEMGYVNVIFSYTVMEGEHFTKERFLALKESATAVLSKKDLPEIHSLFLILTKDVHAAVDASAGNAKAWVIDTEYRNLVIPEDRVEDFYGLKGRLNIFLADPERAKNILAEIRAGHFNLGEEVGEGFKATNSNTFSLAEDGSLVTSATGHVYYDLVSANQPATIYFVGKCPDDTTITRVMARHHANSAGESPGFYTESNKILNATYYGSNSPTSISKTSLFVCAMSLSVISNNKTTYYYANDTFTTNKSVVNAGRYCYFAGTSVTANTPTDTTEYGDAVTISYIGIVNGAEDATTIAANIAAIMTAFGIS